MSEEVKYCKRGHPRTPENVNKYGACKICLKELAKVRYEENKETIKIRTKEYAQKHPGKYREYRKKWDKNNRDKRNEAERRRYKENPLRRLRNKRRIEYHRQWQIKNAEKKKEYGKKYRNNNKDRIALMRLKFRHDHRDKDIERKRKSVMILKNHYVAQLLNISVIDAPSELIELKRLQLQLKREVKNANIH